MIHAPARTWCLALIVFGVIMLAVFAENLGFLEGIDTHIYDTSFRIRGPRTASERIVIVAIDEKTLHAFGRWPLRREYYARLLDTLDSSSVVGFDLILTEPTGDDPLLSAAMQRHGRVIVPVYIGKNLEKIDPAPLFAQARKAHIHVEQGVDNVTRELYHTIYYQGWLLPSMTSAMAEAATGTKLDREAVTTRTDKLAAPGFQVDLQKINYYGPPGTFKQVSLVDVLAGRYPREFFTNKIILVGVTAPGVVDELATPLSQNRDRMSGVEVHANALNNLLDGSSIREDAGWMRWLAALMAAVLLYVLFRKLTENPTALLWLLTLFLLTATLATLFVTLDGSSIREDAGWPRLLAALTGAFLLCAAFRKLNERNATLLWLLSLCVVTATVFTLFTTLNLWLKPTLFYVAITLAYIVTYLYRLDSAARKLDSEHAAITALIGYDGDLPNQGTGERGLLGFLSEGSIEGKIQKLLGVEQQYGRKLEATVQQRTQELSDALSMVSTVSNEMIMRLTRAVESKDEETGWHIVRVGLYARKIAEALGMPEGFVDTIAFASAMHDIGKIGIPDKVLLKTGALDQEEEEIMKAHCAVGERILANSPYPKMQMSAVIALNHHEKWDGSGYPNGLRGEEIPIEARIILICDCYDALRSERHYKQAYNHEEAFRIITQGDARIRPDHFDPRVLQAFVEHAAAFEEIFDNHP